MLGGARSCSSKQRIITSPANTDGTQWCAMADQTAELLEEVRKLREELKQIKEVVNTLVQMVMEMEELDDESPPPFPGNQQFPHYT